MTCGPLVCLQAATSAPLIERSIERATGIVYNITGGKDLTLQVGEALLFVNMTGDHSTGLVSMECRP